jgi:hypothetical protein
MKTTNSLEEQMRSWTPQRPAARIERQLFGAPEAENKVQDRERVLALPWYQTLGASLAGCAVVLFTILNLTTDATQHISQPFAPLSNHLASLAMMTAPHNTWSAPILDWTNERTTGSSMRSFDLLNTNRILP